jgi:hypothetical protein
VSILGTSLLLCVIFYSGTNIIEDAFQVWTIDVFSKHIVTMPITAYLLYTLQLDTTLVCYLISASIVYVAVGLGKLKSIRGS